MRSTIATTQNRRQDTDEPVQQRSFRLEGGWPVKRLVVTLLGALLLCLSLTSCVGRVFYGEWVVKGVVAEGRVTTYGEDELQAVIGVKVTYSADSATFSDSVCRSPHYVETRELENAYEHVSYEQLGIRGDSAMRVVVYCDREGRNRWESPASWFYVKDNRKSVV